ncbi:helix-turn-helix domain-containing protein [Streptomyces bugieae]|uniref:helix-turn-helix domain-containing protein n=1 Tax=Streptomyces bugieae TaxID=3098223 RepID=UPI003AFF7E83
MVGNASRAAIISDRRITGLSADVIPELVAAIGPLWHERHQSKLASRPRKRAVGAGAKHQLVFVDRLLAALVHLRHATTHDVPACWFGVDRSTITRAICEVRRPLAQQGCTINPSVRLRTLAEVVDHLSAGGNTGIIDGRRNRRRASPRRSREVNHIGMFRGTTRGSDVVRRGARISGRVRFPRRRLGRRRPRGWGGPAWRGCARCGSLRCAA